jgi:hypothetical protein
MNTDIATATPLSPDAVTPDAPTVEAVPADPAPAPESPLDPTLPTAAVVLVPPPRPEAEADGDPERDPERGKVKKARKTVRAKSVGGTKALVVWREGRVQYADDSVLVVDLDEAASADLDVHEVVDRLAELREAADSPGRADAVTALAEIIQDKALN